MMVNALRGEATGIYVEEALLNADVDKDIYLKPPQCLVQVDSDTHVCNFVKAVNEIVQAPRYWSKTFAKCVIKKPG